MKQEIINLIKEIEDTRLLELLYTIVKSLKK